MVSNISILLVQPRKKEETHVDGGTSSAGFFSKKLTGLNDTLIISHGMTYSPLSVGSSLIIFFFRIACNEPGSLRPGEYG